MQAIPVKNNYETPASVMESRQKFVTAENVIMYPTKMQVY